MDDTEPWKLLFVCSGNICRSPMAAGIARVYAEQRGRNVEILSAGTLGLVDHPADYKAIAVCRELEIDIVEHLSQAVTQELIDWADYVLVMEYEHVRVIRERFRHVGEKLLMLGTFGGMLEIPDPIGGWKFRFRRSRDEIRLCVEAFIDRLPQQKPASRTADAAES